jgi:hypothetical protein
MNPELIAWLQANGLIGPDGTLNLGDYGTGSVIGNSGLYRREDETPEAFASRLYQAARGNGEWGTAGRGFNDLQNAGLVNTLAPVDMGGVQYQRVGENIADPLFREKLRKMKGGDRILKFFDQYDPASVSRYDPEQGYLMQKDKYDELVRAIDSTKSEGFFADNTPFDDFSKTIGTAMGLSGAIASGLGYAAANPGTFGSGFADWAGSALSNSGYSSLWSGLSANAASQGGSLADIMKAFGGGSGTVPGSNYWNMLADGGATMSDAAPAAAGTMGAPFLGDLSSIINPQNGMLQSLAPNFAGMTPAFTGAGTTGLAIGGGSLLGAISDFLTSSKGLTAAGGVLAGAGSILGNIQQANAAKSASATQAGAAQSGIDEQRRQFDQIVALLSPYNAAGVKALGGQMDLLGINGAGPQSAAITGLEKSPAFTSLTQQGEEAILARGSATGGLRGGNTQRALAQFRPQLLSQLIEQQIGNLGGIARQGQAAAAGQAQQGSNISSNIANLLQQQGAATAGGQIAQGSTTKNAFGDLLKLGAVIGGYF